MKNKKKYVVIGIVIALIVIAITGVIIAYKLGYFYKVSGQQKRYMNEINATSTIVYYAGSLDPGKEITINYKKIDSFTEDTIGDKKEKYYNHEIILFDFDGKLNLSNDELKLIKEYCETKYYDCIYFGTKHLDNFAECGYFSKGSVSDYGFEYNGSYWRNREMKEDFMYPYLVTGIWTENDNKEFDTSDNKIMWKIAVSAIKDIIADQQS